jgi:hypothetical protein
MLRGKLLEVTQITATDRLCYTARMPDDVPAGDESRRYANATAVRLFEDGLEIGPAHNAARSHRARRGRCVFPLGRLLYFFFVR